MKRIKIIKIGGNIIDDQNSLSDFLEQFAKLEGFKVLVHGGGKLASQLADKLKVPVKMYEGRRITNAETLEIITMVYAGKINKTIVAKLQGLKCNAIGLTGADANIIASDKRPMSHIDFGLVGDIKTVDTDALEMLLSNTITPVFCAITHDTNGQLLNTNADTIASEIAIALSHNYTSELYYCFEKNGVLERVSDDQSVISHINEKTYKKLIDKNIIADGLLPKLNNCFHAINNNVNKVCIGKPDMLFNKNTQHTIIQR